jgi:hypothetical protein
VARSHQDAPAGPTAIEAFVKHQAAVLSQLTGTTSPAHPRPPRLLQYTPTQLNCGGVGAVSAGFTLVWPSGRRSPCGDAYAASPKKWLTPRNISGAPPRHPVGQIGQGRRLRWWP